MKRVIFIEPEISEIDIIYDIFKKYNSDSNFVNPHICLVFPFESEIQKEKINDMFNKILNGFSKFEIELFNISISYEDNNNFIFLNVIDNNSFLSKISEQFYNELSGVAKLKGNYTPHITLAKNNSIEEINKIYEKIKSVNNYRYKATVKKIYSKIISKDANGNIILINELEYKL